MPDSPLTASMLGYLPPPEDGELFYSALARMKALYYPDRTVYYAATRILGVTSLSLGGLFPNNCDLLLPRLPPVAGITRESLLRGTPFHLLAPFLVDADRTRLETSMFGGSPVGLRGWFQRGPTYLRYCVACAQEDLERKRPAIWRVAQNHPAVTCCVKHKCKLTPTQARLGPQLLHDPGVWVRADLMTPVEASPPELAVANDVQWLFAKESLFKPGWHSINSLLRRLLLNTPEYCLGVGKLCLSNLSRDIREKLKDAAEALDPDLLAGTGPCVFRDTYKHSIQRYSLLAQLVGWDLRRLVETASTKTDEQLDELLGRGDHVVPGTAAAAKRELTTLAGQYPDLGRAAFTTRFYRLATIVQRHDPTHWGKTMPAPQRHGRNWNFDWAARDEELFAVLSAAAPSLGDHARSKDGILKRAGLFRTSMKWGRKRLPKTQAFLDSLKEEWWEKHRKKRLSESACAP